MFPWTPYELFSPDTVPEWILVILGVIDLLVRIVALGWIPHNRRPSVALAWLLAIFLLPYAGLLLFLVVGSSRLPRKRMEKQAKMNDIIRENTPEDFALGEEFHHLPEWVTTTAKLNYQLGALPMVGGNGFDILTDNHDSMAQMARDVDRATDYVHFEFYIVATDRVSQVLLDSLVRAHERGVRVRILIDHVGSLGYPGYAELVRRFNASGIPGDACCRSARGEVSGSVRTCATTARSWWWTVRSPTRVRRTSFIARTTRRRTSAAAWSGRI